MMTETKFTIGTAARCSDGPCGEVVRVVVDPVARAVTHLVVEPKHHRRIDRLVPVDIVEVVSGEVRLRCSLAEFDKLDPAEETHFLPGGDGYPGYGPGQVLAWPYYGLASGGSGPVGIPGAILVADDPNQPVSHETVPTGEIAVHRGEQVHATDGEIGRVQGLVIDPRDHKVTHVLLQEGHLWGRKQVAIPIGSVDRVSSGIWLTLTKQQVEDLPDVDVDRRNE